MEKKRKTQRRCIINMSDILHAEVKKRASERGITLTKYVLQAISARIKRELLYEGDPHD